MSDFDKRIVAIGPRRHRIAVLQLVNQERRSRGLPSVRTAPSLVVSARAWARALSRQTRFDHGTGAQAFRVRLRRFPFVLRSPRGRRPTVAENIAFGAGIHSTPRAIVAQWMGSASHRATLLGDWRWTAVWTTVDDPTRPGTQSDAVTVVQQFGRRQA